ncbi:glycosyltransferase family 2 protein [Methylobacterium gnaphalii]|uniref:glycosyltransferase family 2 protein n=1 Tax=Methylobacterium gnaphalii TaxID=1010610 RepID=UPI002452C164|nr:glycosyltransferase [Methylobacterium gnaphalii]
MSVVIPTMNSGPWIRQMIHSLIDQVYANIEVIIVDGGSSDNTVAIANSYLGDGDLKILELAPNLGISKALNAGLREAAGTFIARMDADDIAYRWRIHDQVEYLVANPKVALVGTGVDAFGRHEGPYRSPLSNKKILDEYLVNNPFYHPTIMFRREIYDSGLYYYDESLRCEEDYELWGRLITEVEVANMDQSSIRYRVLGGSAQWNPKKYQSKMKGVSAFCKANAIFSNELVIALVEFQNSAFIRPNCYETLRRYAAAADKNDLPRLGWIHDAILREPSYERFQKWFRRTKGWLL